MSDVPPVQPGFTPPDGGPGPVPSWPQQPWGYAPHAPQPPARRRTGLVLGLLAGGAAVLLLIGVAVAALFLTGGPVKDEPTTGTAPVPPTPSPAGTAAEAPAEAPVVKIRLPRRAAGYERMTGGVADRTVRELRREMTKGGGQAREIYDHAKIGLYERGDAMLVVVAVAAADIPDAAPDGYFGSQMLLDGVFLGSGVKNSTGYPAGPKGGMLQCGRGRQGGETMSVCGWTSAGVFGMATEVNGGGAKQLAGTVRAFRSAAES